MLNGNKLKIILALISLMLCITTVQQTYAKYVTSTEAGANMTIARWRILVNDEDIHTGAALANTIVPTFTGTEYIKDGVIAPTSEGYFDLVIDSTNTDLSFTYTINTMVSTESSVSDIKIIAYQLNNGDIINFTGDNHTITGDVLYSNNTPSNTIRVFIKWDDSETNSMNNEADTNASYNAEKNPALNVNLSFIQLNK